MSTNLIEKESDKMSLHEAASEGYLNVVKYLIETKAYPR
ncbi:MAG: ankyrin repeat domain-containing protein [Planctomycetaceae bacterium]|nr:ankyrin repeat domain-containing protein [Planctomycetaceae bacterium]